MNLAELERYFASVATSTSGPPADLHEVFADSPHLPARELMRIYNRGYHYRLRGVLASVFERTERALGLAEFERLAFLYLAQNPSEHPAVERVGRHFASFLLNANQPEKIVDLARLEWARLCALVAPDASIADTSAIDASRFPAQTLRFVPSLSALELAAGTLGMFSETSSERNAQREKRGVVVFRRRYSVMHEVLERDEFGALALALAGENVARICAAFDTGHEANDVARAFSVISSWFAREWVTHIA